MQLDPECDRCAKACDWRSPVVARWNARQRGLSAQQKHLSETLDEMDAENAIQQGESEVKQLQPRMRWKQTLLCDRVMWWIAIEPLH